jgi:protein phosphatase
MFKVIQNLLRPLDWAPGDDLDSFVPNTEEVITLCKEALEVFRGEPMVLECRAPIKVYGDIHGQYIDLMRLFAR